jgi:excisionase family DNA binding protein
VAELYTLDQIADRLQVSRRTVERLIVAGRIRPVRVGRLVRVTDGELDAYLASQRRRFVA